MVAMTDPRIHIIKQIAIPTFIGSLLSFIATSCVIVLHLAFPPKRYFRHALVLNLLAADCINSLNNMISGAIVLVHGYTLNATAKATPACIANAWFGQLSVQTVDFNILIISIVVFLTVYRNNLLSDSSKRSTTLLCLSAWVPGLITSNVALGFHAYGNVSGNWCWIRPDRLDLRYALTHGWRIAVFIATLIIYTCIYIRLKRVFGILRAGNVSTSYPTATTKTRTQDIDTEGILVSQSYFVTHELQSLSSPGTQQEGNSNSRFDWISKSASSTTQDYHTKEPESHTTSAQPMEMPPRSTLVSKVPAPPNVRRMLLLNGYPIAYILLWIPGMANRLVESTRGSSPSWLTALQASTQYVGFVHAIMYGYTEQTRKDLSSAWSRQRRFFKMRS